MAQKRAPQHPRLPQNASRRPKNGKVTAPRYAIGVDIADRTFVATILTDGQWTATSQFEQTTRGFELFLLWMRNHHVTHRSSIVAMETTGVYSQHLCLHLIKNRVRVTVIDAASIARHRSPSRPKSDPADSRAIAEYVYRYPDTIKSWRPKAPELQRLSTLLSLRELYVRNRTATINHRGAMVRAAFVFDDILQSIDGRIATDDSAIEQLDQMIEEVIDSHPSLKQKATLLRSIPGIGLFFAANFLVITEGLELALDPRTIANYLGICPHEYSSGTSVRKRARSSRLGPPRLRKLLNLAARSVCTHKPNFKEYYHRKLRQGKPKMVILNNIANELIRIACAVLRNQTPYIKDYRSVKPTGS
jgi:transposase